MFWGMDGRLPCAHEFGSELLGLARRAVERGPGGALPEPDIGELGEALQAPRASFVTLTAAGRLRGCCGHLEPTAPLGVDVWRAAHASAYRDTRFPPVRREEIDGLRIEVSVLGRPEPLPAGSEPELVEVLRPGLDGVIVALGTARATFLPKVWSSLPEPAAFLRELRRKAGLPGDFWSEDLRWFRYRVEAFGESP